MRGPGDREPRPADPELLEDLTHRHGMRRRSAFSDLGADLAWLLAAEGRAGGKAEDGVGQRRLAVVRDGGG